MKIVRGTDAIDVAHPVFMIIGQPGICKTSLAFSMKDPLLLDFDLGVHRAVNRRDALPIASWSTVDELLADRKALEPYASLIVDTTGRCLDVLTADIATKEPKKAPGGNLSQQGWGTLKTRFRQFVATVRALDKDLLLIAHDKEDKDGDLRVARADIVGGSYGEVMKNADFVGYCYMVGKQRVLDFSPTDRYVGKNPAGWEPIVVPPIAKATTFMADLYDRGRQALGQISEKSAAATNAVEEWRAQVATFKTLEDFNKAVQQVRGLSALLAPQVGALLKEAAGALGFKYDSGKKCYVVDETKKAAPPAQPAESLLESVL